jgi:hypothetical protein
VRNTGVITLLSPRRFTIPLHRDVLLTEEGILLRSGTQIAADGSYGVNSRG